MVPTPLALKLAPTNKFLAMPTPPETIRAPVDVELESVVLLNVETPVNLELPITSNADAGFVVPIPILEDGIRTLELNVETPVTFN